MLNSTATHIVEMYRNTGISVYPYNEDLQKDSCQILILTWDNFDFFDLSAVGELHLFRGSAPFCNFPARGTAPFG